MNVDWEAVKAAADRVRDRLTLPLLAVCLAFAAFSEGSVRAIYLLAAAILCLNYGRYAALVKNLEDLEGDVQSLDNRLISITDGIKHDVTAVEKRVTGTEAGIGILRQDLEALRLSIPPEKSYFAIKLLSLLILVMVSANAAVIILGNKQLAEYGDKIGQVISRVKEIEAQSQANAKETAIKTESYVKRLTEEMNALKERESKAQIIVSAEPQKTAAPPADTFPGAVATAPAALPQPSLTASTGDPGPRSEVKKGTFSKSGLRHATPTPVTTILTPDVRILMPSLDGIESAGESVPYRPTAGTPPPKLKIEVPSNRITIESKSRFSSPEPAGQPEE